MDSYGTVPYSRVVGHLCTDQIPVKHVSPLREKAVSVDNSFHPRDNTVICYSSWYSERSHHSYNVISLATIPLPVRLPVLPWVMGVQPLSTHDEYTPSRPHTCTLYEYCSSPILPLSQIYIPYICILLSFTLATHFH